MFIVDSKGQSEQVELHLDQAGFGRKSELSVGKRGRANIIRRIN